MYQIMGRGQEFYSRRSKQNEKWKALLHKSNCRKITPFKISPFIDKGTGINIQVGVLVIDVVHDVLIQVVTVQDDNLYNYL